MNKPEISQYHKDLAALIKLEPNRAERRRFLAEERNSPQYQAAKKEAILETHRELSPQEQTILWAQKTLEDYNNLPKGNNAERKKVSAFLEKTADHLLQNPQEIDSAASVWKARSGEEQDGFYEAIKQATSTRVKEKWPDIKPETLSELVKVYANNILAKDFGKKLLSSYFRGPENRKERIDAFYTFAQSVIDLFDDQKSFDEAVWITFFGTDILPRTPYMEDKAVIRNWPYLESEETIKRMFITDYATSKLYIFSSNPEKVENKLKEDIEFVKYNERINNIVGRAKQKAVNKYGRKKSNPNV